MSVVLNSTVLKTDTCAFSPLLKFLKELEHQEVKGILRTEEMEPSQEGEAICPRMSCSHWIATMYYVPEKNRGTAMYALECPEKVAQSSAEVHIVACAVRHTDEVEMGVCVDRTDLQMTPKHLLSDPITVLTGYSIGNKTPSLSLPHLFLLRTITIQHHTRLMCS